MPPFRTPSPERGAPVPSREQLAKVVQNMARLKTSAGGSGDRDVEMARGGSSDNEEDSLSQRAPSVLDVDDLPDITMNEAPAIFVKEEPDEPIKQFVPVLSAGRGRKRPSAVTESSVPQSRRSKSRAEQATPPDDADRSDGGFPFVAEPLGRKRSRSSGASAATLDNLDDDSDAGVDRRIRRRFLPSGESRPPTPAASAASTSRRKTGKKKLAVASDSDEAHVRPAPASQKPIAVPRPRTADLAPSQSRSSTGAIPPVRPRKVAAPALPASAPAPPPRPAGPATRSVPAVAGPSRESMGRASVDLQPNASALLNRLSDMGIDDVLRFPDTMVFPAIGIACDLMARTVVVASLWQALGRMPTPLEVHVAAALTGLSFVGDIAPDVQVSELAQQVRDLANGLRSDFDRAAEEIRASSFTLQMPLAMPLGAAALAFHRAATAGEWTAGGGFSTQASGSSSAPGTRAKRGKKQDKGKDKELAGPAGDPQ